ncbi:hypothetical protein [Hyunsoonleella pacifica]|uniref:Uncharacterized protein n=1 Tax=Hyunsoonleella pacifica TaxID=1080224 RepID=A0A4Q9FNU9_9FLAO|nr:hypothetical protein [Hyunsoonleella pacifica]TBN14329.1 hypothetical protein EYD46_12185 [Hyunsoonleella pacifica]GGD12828.1 hypothetical protein GCM10011368_13530 [Hyunsoonleella pacifica]
MKNVITILLLGLVTLYSYAQKNIEKPEYGYSTFPGEITKIEIRDTITVLHFKLEKLPWGYFHIPKESYIQDLSGGNKLFVSEVTGATFKRNFFPSSGVAMYKLFFPPLNKTTKTIDFGIDRERGWRIYDIVLQEDENSLLLPKALRGNWLLADGSNHWDYGFNSKYAIVDGKVWYYQSIDKKGELYTIQLENDGDVKTIYAKQGKNEQVAFGSATKTLKTYSLSKVINPKFSLKGDTEFKNVTFGLDSTSYSGKIKGFSDRMKQKTFMVHVNNAFRGEQESHLVKINADGTFQSKFPLTHPQTVFVRAKSAAYTIFLEPNKETFHYLDSNASYFMGDNAQLNSDLNALKEINFRLGKKERKAIGETSPEDYKKTCFKLKENALNKLNTFRKDNCVSKKAVQLKNIDIMLDFYGGLMSYNMYRSSLQYQNKKAKKEEDKLPFKEFKVPDEYYNFLPDSILDNELLALSNSYYFFTNHLVHVDIFNDYGYRNELSKVERAFWLQKKDVELTTEELNMVENSKQIETPERLAKLLKYKKAYGEIEQGFYKNYRSHFKAVNLALKEK